MRAERSRGRTPPPRTVEAPPPGATEKLQKVLARAGLGSRRELEEWIENGRVSVNGRAARLGDRVGGNDRVAVDGRALRLRPGGARRPRVLRYHKPAGEVCTRRDPEGRPTVFERLPGLYGRRWIACGRLDVNTSGLLLFTDDGELAHRLMHPSSGIEREYAVRVYGQVPPATLEALTRGVALDDGEGRFESLVDAGGEGRNHWYRVVVREGRNRLVRRLWAASGVEVSRLTRIRHATVELPRRLRAGRWDELPDDGVAALMSALGLEPAAAAPSPRARPPRPAPGRGGRGSGTRHRD